MQLLRKSQDRGQQINENVNVADIVFSYNNSDLIHALRSRGSFIALQQFDKAQSQDEEINALFQDFEKLTRPTAAFITFEEEDARILALSLPTDSQLLGLPIKFKPASEPTDIIWENRIYTEDDYRVRQFKAFLILFVLMTGSFFFIYMIARTSAGIAKSFPKVDCGGIQETYGD